MSLGSSPFKDYLVVKTFVFCVFRVGISARHSMFGSSSLYMWVQTLPRVFFDLADQFVDLANCSCKC